MRLHSLSELLHRKGNSSSWAHQESTLEESMWKKLAEQYLTLLLVTRIVQMTHMHVAWEAGGGQKKDVPIPNASVLFPDLGNGGKNGTHSRGLRGFS